MTTKSAFPPSLLSLSQVEIRVAAGGATPWSPGGKTLCHIPEAHIAPSAFVLLAGRNGAGKSTLLRSVLGLLPVHAGEVKWKGGGRSPAPGFVGYVPEFPSFPAGMRVCDWFKFVLNSGEGALLQEMQQLVDDLGPAPLTSDFSIKPQWNLLLKQLSKGQQQKVQLWAAILLRPQILVLDEPFSGLDPWAKQACATLLLQAHRRGMAVWMASHELNKDVRANCTATWLLENATLNLYPGCLLPE